MGKDSIIYCIIGFILFIGTEAWSQPQEKIRKLKGEYVFKNATVISWDGIGMGAALSFRDSLSNEKILAKANFVGSDILLVSDSELNLGSGGFVLEILATQIIITADSDEGLKNGVRKLINFCFGDDGPGNRKLSEVRLKCLRLTSTVGEASLTEEEPDQ